KLMPDAPNRYHVTMLRKHVRKVLLLALVLSLALPIFSRFRFWEAICAYAELRNLDEHYEQSTWCVTLMWNFHGLGNWYLGTSPRSAFYDSSFFCLPRFFHPVATPGWYGVAIPFWLMEIGLGCAVIFGWRLTRAPTVTRLSCRAFSLYK